VERLRQQLGVPVSGASVAIVRIGLGVLIAIESIHYLGSGDVDRLFLDPSFHFTYPGFGWVQPWAGPGMYIHFTALALLAVALALGVAHRIVAPLLTAGFLYVFLLDKTEYLNHYYAAILLLALVALIPADRAISVAARRHPDRSPTVPRWSVWILRFQVGVIYTYAGIAKLGSDWLAGQPMSIWLAEQRDLFLVGPLLDGEAAGRIFSLGGLAFDLLLVPLLLWRRTRVAALVVAVAFHATNWIIFEIGIFPPMMIVATTIFLAPDWPMRLARRRPRPAPLTAGSPGPIAPALAVALAAFVFVQLLVPLRHHLYPGLVHWTEEGHRFAWHMKLRQKEGLASFYAVDPLTGAQRELDLSGEITPRQHARASVWPDMLAQLARHLYQRERQLGSEVQIRVVAPVSLNGRPARLLVNPDADLAAVSNGFGPADWIAPAPDTPVEP
jgi:HTTM domain/Vitamin K-dependent gamma-carboxylase, lumenal domain